MFAIMEVLMIRSLDLKCFICNKLFNANEKLYYQDDFLTNDMRMLKLICTDCLVTWEQSLQVASAVFKEKDCFLYVDITLKNGEQHLNLDCTPMEDIIVTGIDLPESSKRCLFEIYSNWLQEKRKDMVKECLFEEGFMRTTFTCTTFSGEELKDIAFRINRKGQLETEVPVPEKILIQIMNAWRICEITGNNRFIQQ